MRYDFIIVDAVNFAYKTFFSKSTEKACPEQVGKHKIYKEYACAFIRSLESIEKEYLHSDGKVVILFDNYFSRADMQSSFNFADRRMLSEAYKATRKKENKQFYQTLNFIRYYYLINSSKYITARLDNLEADDLVKPAIDTFVRDKNCLLVTSDLDWCRYLNEHIQWLPVLKEPPSTLNQLNEKLKFKVTEANLIAYKAVFGDASDNITPLSTAKYKQQFIDLADEIKFPEQLLLFARKPSYLEKFPFLEAINKNEHQYRVNVQLISAIPCSLANFKAAAVEGRNEKALLDAVKEAIGLVDSQTFVFGNIKRPRV